MDVLMPQLGETVAEGKITQWYKALGDSVQAGDNLFEIETDKTSMEVPATAAGVLAEIRANVGEVVPVGAVVAVISDGKGAAAGAAAGRPAGAASTVPQRPAYVTTVISSAAAADSSKSVHRSATTARLGAAASLSPRSPAGWQPRTPSTSAPSAAQARTGASSLAISPPRPSAQGRSCPRVSRRSRSCNR
jgi:pyruvate/2-oxoglutarate dehydrogenase complex dihydrolipoamide acyltransferase (E2) component